MAEFNTPLPLDPEIARWYDGLEVSTKEFFDERAGIREFEGGLSRSEAEFEAMHDVLRWLIAKAEPSSSE
ncbi:MAG: hypothetical protein ACXV8Q_04030 [Methylobacter sp.]